MALALEPLWRSVKVRGYLGTVAVLQWRAQGVEDGREVRGREICKDENVRFARVVQCLYRLAREVLIRFDDNVALEFELLLIAEHLPSSKVSMRLHTIHSRART